MASMLSVAEPKPKRATALLSSSSFFALAPARLRSLPSSSVTSSSSRPFTPPVRLTLLK
jgi:hypothetical protein